LALLECKTWIAYAAEVPSALQLLLHVKVEMDRQRQLAGCISREVFQAQGETPLEAQAVALVTCPPELQACRGVLPVPHTSYFRQGDLEHAAECD